jgi:hypothetical protein
LSQNTGGCSSGRGDADACRFQGIPVGLGTRSRLVPKPIRVVTGPQLARRLERARDGGAPVRREKGRKLCACRSGCARMER